MSEPIVCPGCGSKWKQTVRGGFTEWDCGSHGTLKKDCISPWYQNDACLIHELRLEIQRLRAKVDEPEPEPEPRIAPWPVRFLSSTKGRAA